jgi:3-deoxy-D-manno-octulosonic-acid transferase
MTLLYNFILLLLQIILYLSIPLIRILNKPLYKEIMERWKILKSSYPFPQPVWIQASSVGEVSIAEQIVKAYKERYPDQPILLTTTTRTGWKLAMDRIKQVEDIRFFPFDFKHAIRAFLDRVQPKLLIMVETEIWPNLLLEAGKRKISCMIVNGRISDKSYRKYQMVKPLISRALQSLSQACMSSPLYADRITALGLSPEKVIVTGNIKFDSRINLSHQERFSLMSCMGLDEDQDIFVAGSTAEGEDPILLDAYLKVATLCERPVFLLAPRHPQRTPDIEHHLQRRNLAYSKLSLLKSETDRRRGDIIVIDTIGDLSKIYSFGTIIFVGGSLVPRGGQNILEPALFGKPVIFGKHMENFKEMADVFLRSGAGFRVQGLTDLTETMKYLLKNKELYQEAGKQAKKIVEKNAGSLKATIHEIERVLQAC